MLKVNETFQRAQESELKNWIGHTGDRRRVLHELIEHSEVEEPLRRVTNARQFDHALEVGVGCFGLGFLAVHLADSVRAIDGLDPLPRLEITLEDDALQRYIEALRARVNYITGMGEAIPAPDAHYDLVASINVVDHAQDPAQILREVDRVLKPGGVFVFSMSTLSAIGEAKWKINRWRHPDHWHYLAHPHTFQWRTADKLARSVPGRVLWRNKPTRIRRVIGKGRMSFWIVEKHA